MKLQKLKKTIEYYNHWKQKVIKVKFLDRSLEVKNFEIVMDWSLSSINAILTEKASEVNQSERGLEREQWQTPDWLSI